MLKRKARASTPAPTAAALLLPVDFARLFSSRRALAWHAGVAGVIGEKERREGPWGCTCWPPKEVVVGGARAARAPARTTASLVDP